VGAFSYSRGLEGAVEAGFVRDESTLASWILGLLEHAVCPTDGALLCRLYRAGQAADLEAVRAHTLELRALRESAELLLEDQQMGIALARLLAGLEVEGSDLRRLELSPSYTTMFTLAAVRWDIPLEAALSGFFFAVAEGQIGAALRLLPLGQSAGQRILSSALPVIERCVARSLALEDHEIGNFTPGLALLSARHETQYSRLFRS
jgi:urease accessory protein